MLRVAPRRLGHGARRSWPLRAYVTSAQDATATTARGIVQWPSAAARGPIDAETWGLARAAGLLAAKQTQFVLPTHLPSALRHIVLWTDDGPDGGQLPAPDAWPEATCPSDTQRGHADDADVDAGEGGFSVQALLDPDVWMRSAPNARTPPPTPPPPTRLKAPSHTASPTAVYVYCRTYAPSPTPTEAMAGCMAACLALAEASRADTDVMPTIATVHIVET